jgi:hypothetical protein
MTLPACIGTAVLLLNLSASSIDKGLQGLPAVQTQQAAMPDSPPQPAKPVVVAQASQPAKPAYKSKKPDPKPEPTIQDLFDYVRGKLISLSPDDGLNDNLDVSYDLATSILSIKQPDGHCDIFFSAIDANSALWETVDPSDTSHKRDELLRLTLTSQNGKKARVCYDTQNQINPSAAANRVRLLFSRPKANGIPDFIDTMDKVVKKLVALSGGTPEKKLF